MGLFTASLDLALGFIGVSGVLGKEKRGSVRLSQMLNLDLV